jgi:outer membrane usher protein
MRHLARTTRTKVWVLLCVLIQLSDAAVAEETRRLQLEVFINDTTSHLIGSFVQLPDRRMAARRAELNEVGIKTPVAGSGNDFIVVDDLPNVTYRYDEPAQRIYFTLADAQRIAKQYNLRGSSGPMTPAPANFGSVLNYTLYAASTKPSDGSGFAFSGANVTLDGRVFGRYGTLSQSAILGSTIAQSFDALRLDTTWSYSDPQTLITYRAGDAISGGLAWTRPIRFGGVQVQRNFSLRPDLVTLPLAAISGSAAVPSTLDVFVNNVKTYSTEVPAGPYQVTNIPTLSGASTAQVVLRDAAGHQTQTSLPFFTSPNLLKQGLMDFSVDAGIPRILYGTDASTYVTSPIGSASLRTGLHDWLTLEAHAETASGFGNAGLGTLTRLGSAGVVSLAGSSSIYGGTLGYQAYAAFDTQIMTFNIHASVLQTFATYNDLASVTARFLSDPAIYQGLSAASLSALQTSIRPPKSLDTLSVGVPLPWGKSSINFAYLHHVLDDGTRSDILNVSYSRSLLTNASFYLSAFTDLAGRKNTGLFFGISAPLGDPSSSRSPIYASTSISSTSTGTNATVDIGQSVQPEPGSYGWRLRDSEGATPYRSAAGTYRASVGQVDAYVQQIGGDTSGSAQLQGSIAMMGGGVFFANRIDDAFAVVDAGAPNVDVLYENRPAGVTNAQGLLLIPNLRSYQRNKISIDPRGLPVDADAPVTQDILAPADRSGVIAAFKIKTDIKAAVVILQGKDGAFIAPGSHGRNEATKEDFVVGYDGRAYLKGLRAANTVVVDDGDAQCRASFAYEPKRNSQVVIGPVACQ